MYFLDLIVVTVCISVVLIKYTIKQDTPPRRIEGLLQKSSNEEAIQFYDLWFLLCCVSSRNVFYGECLNVRSEVRTLSQHTR